MPRVPVAVIILLLVFLGPGDGGRNGHHGRGAGISRDGRRGTGIRERPVAVRFGDGATAQEKERNRYGLASEARRAGAEFHGRRLPRLRLEGSGAKGRPLCGLSQVALVGPLQKASREARLRATSQPTFCVKWTRFPVNDDLRVQIVWCRTRSSFGCSPQVSGGAADGDVGPVAARQGRRIAEGAEARQVRNNWRGRPRQARPSRARPGDDTTESTDTIESTESRFGRLKDAKRKGDRLGRVGRASSRSKGADG